MKLNISNKKKLEKTDYIVLLYWSGTFSNKLGVHQYTDVCDAFAFDYLPTEDEIVDCWDSYRHLKNDSDWSDIIITDYSILPPVETKNIIIENQHKKGNVEIVKFDKDNINLTLPSTIPIILHNSLLNNT